MEDGLWGESDQEFKLRIPTQLFQSNAIQNHTTDIILHFREPQFSIYERQYIKTTNPILTLNSVPYRFSTQLIKKTHGRYDDQMIFEF